MTTIHIKNMVCGRCIKTVATIFEQEGITPESVGLGEVRLKTELNKEQEKRIKALLESEGLNWLDDQKTKLIEEI